jgi:hypothetical protein
MNLSELESKLFAAARSSPLDDRVPYGFERRVLARIRGSALLDPWAVWSRALWRATAPCVSIMLFLAAWSWLAPAPAPGDLAQDFENTLLSAADHDSSVDAAE